jgi:hypothetical protein
MSSPPTQRRRSVGLANPRGARGIANNQEIQRLAHEDSQHEAIHQLAIRAVSRPLGLDLYLDTSSESDIGYDPYDPDPRTNGVAQRQAEAQQRQQPSHPASSESPDARGNVASRAASTSARSRTQWNHNHAKLNLMARYKTADLSI